MKRLLALLSQPVTGGFLWHQSVKEMDAIRHRSESVLCRSRRVFHQKQSRAWAAGEEAALYSSLKASGRYMPMDMADAVVEWRSAELVIGSRTLMFSFCAFLLIFLFKIISYFLMRMFFR